MCGEAGEEHTRWHIDFPFKARQTLHAHTHEQLVEGTSLIERSSGRVWASWCLYKSRVKIHRVLASLHFVTRDHVSSRDRLRPTGGDDGNTRRNEAAEPAKQAVTSGKPPNPASHQAHVPRKSHFRSYTRQYTAPLDHEALFSDPPYTRRTYWRFVLLYLTQNGWFRISATTKHTVATVPALHRLLSE